MLGVKVVMLSPLLLFTNSFPYEGVFSFSPPVIPGHCSSLSSSLRAFRPRVTGEKKVSHNDAAEGEKKSEPQ
jgi:hypothetical protein